MVSLLEWKVQALDAETRMLIQTQLQEGDHSSHGEPLDSRT